MASVTCRTVIQEGLDSLDAFKIVSVTGITIPVIGHHELLTSLSHPAANQLPA